MEIDWNAEVVEQLHSHWQDRLRPRLDGLTDDELFWLPVSSAQPAENREPVTTIAWRLTHLIEGLGPPTIPHFKPTTAAPPFVDFGSSAREALHQLDEAYEAWIADVRHLGPTGLAQPQGLLSPSPFADFPLARKVMYVHVEVIHHGAEVCLLRDLYAARSSNGASL
ncbi:DinB family protein [Kribbella sp. CA-294648]|uniref:DinB family protein n=1 Tax=Kribbella sp. CA-294648 TaxID=3239948 RepID=UPI003D89D1ED